MSEVAPAKPRSAPAQSAPAAPAAPARPFADVLCAVDGTRRSTAAVGQAAALAGPEGQLTLLAVTAVLGSGAYRNAALSPARATGLLESAQELAAQAGVSATAIIDPAGPPAQVIMQRAASHDLLAMGAPASSRLGGLITDGVAVSALGAFTTPLLLARPLRGSRRRFADRILVASDGLQESDALVALAGRLASAQGSAVTLLHAAGVESQASAHRISEQARALQALLGSACEVRVETGGAGEAIVAGARQSGASLIVTGSRRLAGLKSLGSVSRRVAHEARCSVLLVPPELLHG